MKLARGCNLPLWLMRSIAVVLSTASVSAIGQETAGGSLKSFEAVRATGPIVIDGVLDESDWAIAAVVDDVHQVVPIEYAEPTQETTILVLYDNEAIYVAAIMNDDEPDRITANVMRQGGEHFRDDMFDVYLHPFNDQRSGYRFQLNPNGVFSEGLFVGPSQMQWDWEGIWQPAAVINDDGWVVEIRIPFRTLTFDPTSDTWGMNFARRVARNNENIGWVSRNQALTPAISGQVTGLEGLEQGVGLDVVPTITANERRVHATGESTSELEPSLDVFYKLTPSLNASLTINTDFSAVEVDERQVNLTRFGLFFPERRDFFLQDFDIFEFGRIGQREQQRLFPAPLEENARPFFSRRIGLSPTGEPVDLVAGAKLTGRVGRWNVGTLAIRQDEFEDVETTDLFVGRMTANILQESQLGFIITDGDPQSNLDNSAAGVDFLYQNTRLPQNRVIESELWYQQSETEGLEGDDSAWGARFWMPNSRGFRGGLGLKEIERNFNPAQGFVNRRNIQDLTSELGYTHLTSGGGRLRSVYSGARVQRIERLTGGLQSQNARLRVRFENQTGDAMTLQYQSEKEGLLLPFEIFPGIIIPPGDYEFDQGFIVLNTGPQRRVVGNVSLSTGDFYDGTRDRFNANLELKPSPHFRAYMSYEINDVKLPQGDFELKLVRLSLDFAFSARLSWTNLFQYDNASELLGFNSRIHWRPRAGRDMFIVFNHNLEDFDRDNEFEKAFSDFSFKFSYTFRF